MICTKCGAEMKRVCRACQARRAYQGMLIHQRRYLRSWQAGAIEVRVREQSGVLHMELFDMRWHAFCGAELFTITPRQRVRELPANLCADCRRVFDGIVAQLDPKEGVYAS